MDLALFQISAQDVSTLRAWGEKLMTTRRTEALQTLRQENRYSEAMYLIGDLVLCVSLLSGPLLPADPKVKINREHKKVMKLLKPATHHHLFGAVEVIYHLTVS